MRRLAITILIAPLVGLAVLSLLSPSAHASTPPNTGTANDDAVDASQLAPVDVLQVSGIFDKIIVRSIEEAIDRAESSGAEALILQLTSRGAVVTDAEMTSLLQRVADAKVPIGIWVGPSRSSRAYGLPAQLMAVADVTAMVGGSRIGYISDPLIVDGQPISFGPATADLVDGSMSFNEARAAGVLKLDTTDQGVPTVRNMILAMDGKTIDGHEVNTVVKQLDDKGQEQNVSTTPVFNGLGLFEEVLHTVASPPMAFLLFVIGLALLIFEFFTAGVGIAGAVGAACVVLGCYGLTALPTRPVAVGLLILSMLAFAIDVQVGIPRLWTGVGIVLFIIGAWYLYGPVAGNDLRLGWITLIVAVGGVMLTFIVGMPSMVRTRFATPTIGREWMIGHEGTATTSIDPEGVALVSGARWRARTNRATPIAAGSGLKVVAIDGVTLEVEPEQGAARDYRERRVKQQ
ncbi:MAG TPA: NfeD family protein [Ilumatobacteraceae bacterium]|nr:NfeD family protein [Ilumatobacteraceae bacterium]